MVTFWENASLKSSHNTRVHYIACSHLHWSLFTGLLNCINFNEVISFKRNCLEKKIQMRKIDFGKVDRSRVTRSPGQATKWKPE